jgi:hypothetical protein
MIFHRFLNKESNAWIIGSKSCPGNRSYTVGEEKSKFISKLQTYGMGAKKGFL